MLSGKVIDRGRAAVVALLVAMGVCAGCMKRADSILSAPPASNPSAAFSLDRKDGKWWLVAPGSQKFFSMGVCVVSHGSSKEEFDPENPSYAAWQHYANSQQWAESTAARLNEWRFTTAGGWSDYEELKGAKERQLFITPVLHMGSTSGLPWWDMWDEKNVARMEEVAREKILAVRNDPRLIGYYSDNELGWWNVSLWKATLEQPTSSGQRRRLMAILREEYRGNWKELEKDFESDAASSFEELEKRGVLYLRPGEKGILVMRKFLGLLAERYYALAEQIIRKYDKRGLILGDRYPSFYYPEVVRAASRHVDVVSTNLNAAWEDGSFPRFQLETLYGLTHKPILVTEIYMSASENRSGNRNRQGGFPVVKTQAERAKSARNTIERLARLPFVVGVDWFQWADEPTHGRFDGENFNFGLVDIHDRAYEELTGMLAGLDVQRIKREGGAGSRTLQQIPRGPQDPFENFVQFKALKNWDRDGGLIAPQMPAPLADLYVCWNSRALYLAVHGWDAVEKEYYRGGFIPKEDRALWSVRIEGKEVARARIGGGREAMVSEAAVRVESIPVGNSSAWMTAGMEVPAKLLGKDFLAVGDEIKLECVLVMHGRAERVEWKGKFKLAE